MKKSVIALVALLALIVLPTGTPEDLFTTLPLIATLGINGYLFLVAAVLLLLLIFGGRGKD